MYERGFKRSATLALFLGPAVIGAALFLIGPILASLVLAFSHWDLPTPATFAGLPTFRTMLSDPEFWAALRHTLTFIIGYVPPVMVLGFLLSVTSWVAVGLVWKWLFNLLPAGIDPFGGVFIGKLVRSSSQRP